MKVSQIANISIALSRTPASLANFGVAALLVDHADIPIDKRYRITSRSAYATDFTASTAHLAWFTELWSQNLNMSQAYACRWVSAASSPYITFPGPNTTISGWTSLTTGALKIVDSAAAEDTISSLDFSSVTSLADIATVIQTALQAIATPSITGLDTATCFVDKLSRIIIQNSTSGASALTITAAAPAAGDSLIDANYLGTVNFSQAALDAEAPETAVTAVLALDDTPFAWAEQGCTTAQQVTFSTGINGLQKICDVVINDTDAKDSTKTVDTAYLIGALNHQKTHMSYTEHTTQYPDAGWFGEILPALEATYNVALTPLGGVSESGLGGDGTTVLPLTDTERAALETKGCDYLVNPAGLVHYANGLAAGGNEIRIMIGKMFTEAKVSEEYYAYLTSNPVVTFSTVDLEAYKAIMIKWLDIMVERKVLDPGYTIDWPTVADFNAAAKATHQMDLTNVAEADGQLAVNKVTATLSWAI